MRQKLQNGGNDMNEEFDRKENTFENNGAVPESKPESAPSSEGYGSAYSPAENRWETVAPKQEPVQNPQPMQNPQPAPEPRPAPTAPQQPYGYSAQSASRTWTPNGYQQNQNPYSVRQTGYAETNPSYAGGYSPYVRQNPQTYPAPQPKEKKSGNGSAVLSSLLFSLLFSLIFSVISGFCVYSVLKKNQQPVKAGEAGPSSPAVIYQTAEKEENPNTENKTAVSFVVDKVADSVVEITTETTVDSFYYGRYVSEGAGSGVIISKDGYVVTNNHVIADAENITVTLRNGTSYPAKLIGTDEVTDIAVIKIEAEGLTNAVLGDSSKLVVGELAVAIGNPLGRLGGTVTDGIISALDREITISDETMTLIQTNAAVNPGNSGGGLFNAEGELIGIVNAKNSGSEIEGLSFAVPINTAKGTIEQLLNYGYVRGRAILGVGVREITNSSDAWRYRVSEFGVYIISSVNGDFEVGDRIMAIDGNSVTSRADIKAQLKKYGVGDEVTVTVSRNGRMVDVKINLVEETPEMAKTEKEAETKESLLPGSGADIWDIFDYFGF